MTDVIYTQEVANEEIKWLILVFEKGEKMRDDALVDGMEVFHVE